MLTPILEPVFAQMRKLDLHYAQEPDLYVANSSIVAQRIERIYNRPASFINYPIKREWLRVLRPEGRLFFWCLPAC